MAPEVTPSDSRPVVLPRILLVDDEPEMLELVGELARRSIECQVICAASAREARDVLESQPIDMLVADIHLPDGDGTSLIETLQLHHPTASAIVITGSPSVDHAIDAIRHGALDFVPKPFTSDMMVQRLRSGLERQAAAARHDQRFERLRSAVKRLSESRRTISKKVDLLCNDLVGAYGELSRQLDVVRTQEAFRKFIGSARDLEQLLCHAMDFLMRQVGYCNVGVWLAGEDGDFQLGAYMKYTVAGDPPLVNALKRELLPMAGRDGVVHIKGEDLRDCLTPQEMHPLKGQDILAVHCTYLGESLATVVFFRDAQSSFSGDDEALVKAVSPLFAIALASVVHGEEKEAGDSDAPFFDGETQTDFDDKPKPKKPRRDPADWWKTGEAPPF
jgi:FixJ family two-component response regulator